MLSNFLSIPERNWIAQNDLAFAVYDGFPVSAMHALVIPRRLVADWFTATHDEQRAMMDLVAQIKDLHVKECVKKCEPPPDGWNVGFNAGRAAGQTVMHCHLHVIPRWHGDVPDPRGGVRHVIPGKGNYSVSTSDLCTGYPEDHLWNRLRDDLIGAQRIDILSSFVQCSGVDLIEDHLLRELRKGAAVRILAGDYLGISDPSALRQLHSIATLDLGENQGTLHLRVLELSQLTGKVASFHPKSWCIQHSHCTITWVGSSNLSHAALNGGIEWNLRATSSDRPQVCDDAAKAFDDLWSKATEIDKEWITAYAERVRQAPITTTLTSPPDTAKEDELEPLPWQGVVLNSLKDIRSRGHDRALAVVATGMGKTVLAGLDCLQCITSQDSGKRILIQAARTLRRILGWKSGNESWCLGEQSDLDGRLVLASIQKLGRKPMLERLSVQYFDYVIIDEVHHLEAPSWKRVLAQIRAGFILGLTATPERADGKHVATLFDDIMACDIGLAEGIKDGVLVPFSYIGLADAVDYQHIPWRKGGFELDALEEQLISTSERMNALDQALKNNPGTRSLFFCCSQRHARFVADWLNDRGVTAAAVFHGAGSDDRAHALASLRRGSITAICAVDMFNEGLDIPEIDRVIMLRPSESPVLLAQQLGRGLRKAEREGKSLLRVIDFVGNHRCFLRRTIHLAALMGLDTTPAVITRIVNGDTLPLPPECLIDIETKAIELLKALLPPSKTAILEAVRTFYEEFHRRPRAAEIFHRGMLINTLKPRYGSWFGFLAAEGFLQPAERQAYEEQQAFLNWVESTSLNKSYKMIALDVLCEHDALWTGQNWTDHVTAARNRLLRHPNLRDDLQATKDIADHASCDPVTWGKWWQRWPITHAQPWLSLTDNRLHCDLSGDLATRDTVQDLVAELVEWRLAQYIGNRLLPRQLPDSQRLLKISHSGGKPILRLPDATQWPDRPRSLCDVILPDGSVWEFKFVKVACNVANPKGQTGNHLPELFREWFGPQAGLPGTQFKALLRSEKGLWYLEPESMATPTLAREIITGTTTCPFTLLDEPSDDAVAVYDLAAAAGIFSGEQRINENSPLGWLNIDMPHRKGDFIMQVRGDSMIPRISDGDWCLFRPGVSGSRQGRIVLVAHHTLGDDGLGSGFTVKRYSSLKKSDPDSDWQHRHIQLEPLNPAHQPIVLDQDSASEMKIVAEFLDIVEVGKGKT